MSAHIDIISERSELGQGSWVRLEEIGRASTVTLDDRYRFAARSVNLTWPLCGKTLAASICRRSEKSFSASSFWRATVLAMYRAKQGVFPLQRTNASRNFGY